MRALQAIKQMNIEVCPWLVYRIHPSQDVNPPFMITRLVVWCGEVTCHCSVV